jgi:hypothetical protein
VDDLTRKDFVAVHGLLKAFKWKRQQSTRHGDRWHRPVEA